VRIVVAVGGNALLERGESPDAEIQQRHIRVAVDALAPLARSDQLVITHGNGPQVGLLALESATDPVLTRPYPLDVLVAQTQGMIGYWFLQGFQNAVEGREIAGVITQTLVSAADPGFADPAKFVGPGYPEAEARRIAAERGWTVKADGNAWRRVVASPQPLRIVETRLIRQLLDSGAVVICAGGGGAPVVRNRLGELEGIEAVVDKDTATGLLAEALDADVLLVLTDVASVQTDYGTPAARPIHRATPADLRALGFPAGSMGPKVEAVCRFVELTGGTAAIGSLRDVDAILAGKAGTVVTPSGTYSDPDDRRPGGRPLRR
jgi:carbamate kinase